MLKRIAVIGTPTDDPAVRKLLDADDAYLTPCDNDTSLPSFTDALACAADTVDTVSAALLLAARHESVLLLLAEAIDCREGLVPGSSRRVMDNAARFAKALGLEPDDQLTLERGALLRDVGKLKISNAVLLKDGLLDYDEWRQIQAHTQMGADLARAMDGFQGMEDIVRRHHEAWDGDGYPDRLEREAIPFSARIVKIVDVYCAMTSPRPYREGVASKEQALDHLRAERGKHFDPELVDVFLDDDLGDEPLRFAD